MMEQTLISLNKDSRDSAGRRVHGTIRALIPRKKQKEALIILKSMIEQTKLEPGCISCRLYHDAQEERAIMLEEIWASENDLHCHLRTTKFHRVLLVVEMAAEPPEIRFDVVAHSTGLETIERARTWPDGKKE